MQIIKVHNRDGVAHSYPLVFSHFCLPAVCVLKNDSQYAYTAHIAAYSTHDIRVVTRWTNENDSGIETSDVIIFVLGF